MIERKNLPNQIPKIAYNDNKSQNMSKTTHSCLYNVTLTRSADIKRCIKHTQIT